MYTPVTETRLMWGMPITIEIVETRAPAALAIEAEVGSRSQEAGRPDQAGFPPLHPAQGEVEGDGMRLINRVFNYFEYIDGKFSTYKTTSEISLINQGALAIEEASLDMRTVFALAEQLRQATGGYFNIQHNGTYDPSGLVKGWAVSNAAAIISDAGYDNFYVEAGGDFQAAGYNAAGKPWRIGIRSPFNPAEIVKVLSISNCGVATSGTYIRGQHIYNPVDGGPADPEILSLTVISPDVYDADCYATAAFAMGRNGIGFIESLEGFEGYMIDRNHQATFTSGFERYVDHAAD